MTTQPQTQTPPRPDSQVMAALAEHGLTVGPGTLHTATGQPVQHPKIIWIDTGGLVWHGSARRRVIDLD